MENKFASIFFIFSLSLFLSGCGGDEEEDSVFTGETGPIETNFDASDAADDILAMMVYARTILNNGSHSGAVVMGDIGGSASVTGTVSFQDNINCGTGCIRDENATTITVTANNFTVQTVSNGSSSITGTVLYQDNTWSQQNGLSFSSGGSVTLDINSNAQFRSTFTTSANTTFGTVDTISFLSSSGSSQFQTSGSLQATNGSFTW